MVGLSRWIMFLGICSSMALSVGCQPAARTKQPSPPGPEEVVGETENGDRYTFLTWQEGLQLLIVDQYGDDGWRRTSVESGTGQPFVRRSSLTTTSQGGETRFEWAISTTDGQEATFSIDQTEYELDDGAVFVLTPNGDTAEVTQLDIPLASLAASEEACDSFVASHLPAKGDSE